MSNLNDLENLGKLYKQKLISKKEFDSQRAMLLDKNLKQYQYAGEQKSRVVYIVLAIFFGIFGVHNFYAGYTKKGATQLVLTVLSPLTLFIALLAVTIWVLVDIVQVTADANGEKMTE